MLLGSVLCSGSVFSGYRRADSRPFTSASPPGRGLSAGLITFLCGSLAAAASAQAQPQDNRLEEIVVTAQYREERLQDVPISISAFSGTDLRDMRVLTPADLARVTPGLFMNRSSVNQSDPEFTLRGIGTNDSSPNQNPATPLYVDGVSAPFNAMVGHILFDMERVEVLKGPQGTLYGRNSTAGAVNFISTRPGDVAEGYLTATYGERDRTDIEAAFTLPVNDSFSLRFAGRMALENGWQTIDLSDYVRPEDPSFLDPVRKNGETETRAFRITSRWQPSDSFEMITSVDLGRDDGEVLGFKHAGNLSAADPSQFCSYVATGDRNDGPCVSFAYDSRTAPRIPVSIGGYDMFVQDPADRGELVAVFDDSGDERTTIKNFSLGSDVNAEAQGFTNTAVWNTSRVDITSVTGLRSFERNSGYGQQGGPFITIGGRLDNDMEVFTQELRVASNATWENVYWVGGLFYSQEEIGNTNVQTLAEHKFFSAIFMDTIDQDTDIYAAFGQLEWDINEQWQLIAGGRFTSEDRSFTFEGDMVGSGPQIVPFYGDEVESEELTWRFGLNYRPSDEQMWYASVSRGFRGKGFPASISFDIPQLLPFEEESLIAWEAGLKSTLLEGDLQLNAAAYYYDFQDFQAQTAVEREGLRLIVLANAGDAEVAGLEVDARWRPTQALTLSAGINWMDAEIQSGDYDGDSLPRSPDLMASGSLRYQAVQSINGFEPFAQLDYSYNSAMDFILPNQTAATEGSYWLLNARIGTRLPDPKWEVYLFAENLADEVYKAEVFGPGSDFLPAGILYGPPRLVGATVSYSF